MVFLACVLKKKYTNPSSDVITVLAGLDEVDHVISDFVSMLDGIIRKGSSSKYLNGMISTISTLYNRSSSRCSGKSHSSCHCNGQRGIQNEPRIVLCPP